MQKVIGCLILTVFIIGTILCFSAENWSVVVAEYLLYFIFAIAVAVAVGASIRLATLGISVFTTKNEPVKPDTEYIAENIRNMLSPISTFIDSQEIEKLPPEMRVDLHHKAKQAVEDIVNLLEDY